MKSSQPATQARLALVTQLPTLAMASSGRAPRVTSGSRRPVVRTAVSTSGGGRPGTATGTSLQHDGEACRKARQIGGKMGCLKMSDTGYLSDSLIGLRNRVQLHTKLTPRLRPAVRTRIVRSVMAASEGPLEHHIPAARTAPDDPPHGPGWPVRFIEHPVIRNRQ